LLNDKMNIKTIVVAVAALAIGVSLGFWMDSEEKVPQPEAAEGLPERGVRISDVGESAKVKALRAKVAELERKIALTEKASSAEAAPVTAVTTPPPAPESYRDRMARLEKDDPARYAQITNRIANWRNRRAQSARERIDFLSSIDTSKMSGEAKKVHDELQLMVAKREELEQNLHQPGLDDSQRRELFGELRKTGAKMHELNMKERDNLLAETARNLGFEGEDAEEIVATIKEVVKATDSGWGFGRGFGRGRMDSSGSRRR
jgi:hypothetical protein